jgi:hypothetical protein
MMMPGMFAAAVLLLLISDGQNATPAAGARAATPIDATQAILDAFRTAPLVGLGDAHGNQQGEAFHLALVRDPRFAAVVNDVIVESGNSRYQEVLDRYVRGEVVPTDALQRIWLDTTQQHVASLEIPGLITAIRTVNASLPPDRRVRVLLGEPPIEWERIRTAEDMRKWDEGPLANRDQFAAQLIRTEVLARNRRALALYGAGHFFRKVISESLVTILEGSQIKIFTIWTNAAAEMAKMQPDVAAWPVPSLAHLRGTVLGRVNLSEYFGPGGGGMPPQWQAPLEEQFDAVLYLGPLASITLGRPQPWRCVEPAMPERVRRLRLQRPALADRVEQECVR